MTALNMVSPHPHCMGVRTITHQSEVVTPFWGWCGMRGFYGPQRGETEGAHVRDKAMKTLASPGLLRSCLAALG
jgi:hypothetical protein